LDSLRSDDVRKIVLALLGLLFISETIRNLMVMNKSYINYLYFFISIGIIVIYICHKIISKEKLTFGLISTISINLLSIVGLYVYGLISSNSSFGLGFLIMMLITLLISQIIIFIIHTVLSKINNNEQIENKLIIGYTFIFIILNQVSIPQNYVIPITTLIMSYSIVFILFIGLFMLITKILKKDIVIVLIISLVGLLIIQSIGLDANIFLRLPFQIVVLTLLIIQYIPLKTFK
jgi:hypothetical protein